LLDANRLLKIRKTRNGSGGGTQIGFEFEGGTLRFTELGVVVEDKK